MSFAVDREVVVAEIERYFEMTSVGDMIFDDEVEEVLFLRFMVVCLTRKLHHQTCDSEYRRVNERA